MLFKSKTAWYIHLIFASTLLVMAWAVVVTFTDGDMGGVIFATLTATITTVIIVPIWLWTDYTFEDSYLRIRCGWMMRYRINYTDITSITDSNSLISSPALSHDRLEITYGRGSVLVSPHDKLGFTELLRERVAISNSQLHEIN